MLSSLWVVDHLRKCIIFSNSVNRAVDDVNVIPGVTSEMKSVLGCNSFIHE